MWVFACAYVSYLSLIAKKYDSQKKNKKKTYNPHTFYKLNDIYSKKHIKGLQENG